MAAVVASFVDELLGGFVVGQRLGCPLLSNEQSSLFQMVIGEVEAHAAASGENADFFEIVLGFGEFAGVAEVGGSGEEAEGEMVEGSGTPEAAYGLVEILGGFGGAGRVGAAEGEMIEGDVEQPGVSPRNLNRLGCATEDFFPFTLRQEEVAVSVTLDGGEEARVCGTPPSLHLLGFLEQRGRLGGIAGLVKRVGECCALAQPLEFVPALVGGFQRTAGCVDRVPYVAERQVKLAQVAKADRCVFPVRLGKACRDRCLDRLEQLLSGARAREARRRLRR